MTILFFPNLRSWRFVCAASSIISINTSIVQMFSVLWGSPRTQQMKIRAKVAAFPYYNEEYPNETLDVEKIPHSSFT